MLIKRAPDIVSSEITDQKSYLNRRTFMRAAAGTAAGLLGGRMLGEAILEAQGTLGAVHGRKLDGLQPSPLSTTEKQNSWQEITTYNNFVEFGQDKADPAR